MANGEEITTYKNQIVSRLISDSRILNLINDKDLDPSAPEVYVQSHIYDYIYVPKTIEDEAVYICLEIDEPKPYGSSYQTFRRIFSDYEISIVIIVHTKIMHGADIASVGGTRLDRLAQYIREDISGAEGIALEEIEFISNVAGACSVTQRMRTLKFKAKGRNEGCF